MKNEIILTEANKKEINALSNALSEYRATNVPRASLSNKQRVLSLRAPITEMITEGFTYDDIATALEKGGLKLKASTIREYLKESSNRKTSRRKSKSETKEVLNKNNTGNESGNIKENPESNKNQETQSDVIAKQRTSNDIPDDSFDDL